MEWNPRVSVQFEIQPLGSFHISSKSYFHILSKKSYLFGLLHVGFQIVISLQVVWLHWLFGSSKIYESA